MNKLQELLGDRVHFVQSIDDWREAIRRSAESLLKDDCIEKKYVDAMIEGVEKLGPYMILTDGLIMPHSRPENGAKKASMSFLKVENGVKFPEANAPVTLFFTLAAVDSDSHLEAMMKLAEVIDDEQKFEALKKANTKEEVIKLIG